jgi:hypothetical protein
VSAPAPGKFHVTGSAPPLDVGGGLYIETEYRSMTYTAWPDGTVTLGIAMSVL